MQTNDNNIPSEGSKTNDGNNFNIYTSYKFNNVSKNKKMRLIIMIFFLISNLTLLAQDSYFPPISGDQWATIDPKDLGWCEEGVAGLYSFLEEKETKAFIVLKDGKIAVEKYFGTFTKDSIWYWASAGKSLAGFLTGMAQEKGLLDIQDKTSKYLGQGWTNLTPEQENKITIWHQLSMTTGLDDNVPDDNCMLASCLNYKAAAGTRWAYHNAPYRLIHEVIGKAWGSTMQNFMNTQLTLKTGISGLWYDGVMYSKPRSMARFGLLMLNSGNWNGQKILSDQNFIQSMIIPSQELNKSYGLLWWLNGQSSFMLPGSQIVFNGTLIPNAPGNTWCALGKNDQKIYIVPSEKLVIIRMGQDGGQVTGALSSFDNFLWEKLNDVFCTSSMNTEISLNQPVDIYPNPFMDNFNLCFSDDHIKSLIQLFNSQGKLLFEGNKVELEKVGISRSLNSGIYFLRVKVDNKEYVTKKLIKI